MVPLASINAATLEFPISARSRLAMNFPAALDEAPEPRPDGVRVRQSPMRARAAFAHFDRAAPDPIDQLEAEFVGEIVADEHRQAPLERNLLEKFGYRRALVLPARLDLHHHFSRLQLEVVAQLPDQ